MYKIIFDDNSTYSNGQDLNNSGWNEMPNKSIKKIEYNLLGHTLILEGYELYNHLVMHSNFLFLKENTIIKVILLAKNGTNVKKFTFDLINDNLIEDKVIYGKELNNSFTTGWKKGIENGIIKNKID